MRGDLDASKDPHLGMSSSRVFLNGQSDNGRSLE